ncbi:hypothetical protein Dsin_028823 [Dipteronia sinensis]|uniref:hAT-like transposase RNase-H fold domain-containing protein n=1 Tax=Dipteronia sinensis TaxID=43782 RepID=A0AAD9ZSL3_9ROSI|nr:hypothetical protein Dsin_028823 [Dipteronia sinensis]
MAGRARHDPQVSLVVPGRGSRHGTAARRARPNGRHAVFTNMKLAESGCPPAQSLTPDDWEDDMLGPAVVAMETKFKKYWSEMPFLYALGVIVDPRIKLAGLEYLLEFIGNKLSVDYSDQITDIQNKLFKVFSIYERKFDGVDTEPSLEPDTQPLPTSWSILKRRKKDKSASCYSSTTQSAASSGAELNRFLEAQFDADENKENFDLLLWWKTYSYSSATSFNIFVAHGGVYCAERTRLPKHRTKLVSVPGLAMSMEQILHPDPPRPHSHHPAPTSSTIESSASFWTPTDEGVPYPLPLSHHLES